MEEIALDCSSSYIINPCGACHMRLGEDVNINELNNCVTETAAAFTNFPSNLAVEKGGSMVNWAECMKDAMAKVGRTPCDFQLNPAPVFAQYPHYFPRLLFDLGDRDKALQGCIKECTLNKDSSECFTNCKTDYDAVNLLERKEDFIPAQNMLNFLKGPPTPPTPSPRVTIRHPPVVSQTFVKERYNSPKPSPSPGPMPAPKVEPVTFSDYYKSNPVAFSVSFLIVAILLSFVLYFFFEALTSNKFMAN